MIFEIICENPPPPPPKKKKKKRFIYVGQVLAKKLYHTKKIVENKSWHLPYNQEMGLKFCLFLISFSIFAFYVGNSKLQLILLLLLKYALQGY